MKKVNGVGPKPAKLMLVGEAPGAEEERLGEPFVGNSGKKVDLMLLKAGLPRTSIRIDNVVPVRPPNNKIAQLHELGLTVEEFYPRLFQEITETAPNVILAMGGTALAAVCNLGKIMVRRGSVLYSQLINGKSYKVVPTIHPAAKAVLMDYSWMYIIARDIKLAVKESSFPDIRSQDRTFYTSLSFSQILDYLEALKQYSHICIDLETYYCDGLIRAIGLAPSEIEAISIPILDKLKPVWSLEEEQAIWERVVELLQTKKVIAQNAPFELSQLQRYSELPLQIWMCTLRAHALVYPELPHGLDFLASIYTDMPYYKDEGKATTDKAVSLEELQVYNCKDCVATSETAIKLERELKEVRMYEFYHDYQNPLMHLLFKMEQRGVRIDTNELERLKTKFDLDITKLSNELESLVGYKLNPKSTKQMREFLYGTLALPKKFKRGTGQLTANEDALLALYAKTQKPELKLLLDIRRLRTLKETFLEMKLSPDGRIRTSYGVTETGRLSSSKTIFGVGANLQNIPKRKGAYIRAIFVPDPGLVLMKGDLSQAEARIVAWLAEDRALKEIFRLGGDIHKVVASLVFGKPLETISPEERYISKQGVHANSYGVGAETFAKTVGITTKQAGVVLAQIDKTFPNIKSVFHAAIQQQLQQNRTLVTPFGRRRQFLGRYGDSLFREGYSYIPQSTVADIINKGMLELEPLLPKSADLLLQIHDELLLQCEPKHVKDIAINFKACLEHSIIVNGEPLIIPLDIKVGTNWYKMEDLEE